MTDFLAPEGYDAPETSHYLRALTEMADKRALVTETAIFSETGIKLVEKGTRIDSHLYDRLVMHKLREPIDRHLTIANPVDIATLLEGCQALIDTESLPRMMALALGSAPALMVPLGAMPLPGAMACKLTVMRDQRPDLWEHSLQIAMVAVYLGIRSGLSELECQHVAAAALLHDIGVLYMDPAWSDPDHKVVGAQRKHLVAHPISAMLMVRDAGVYPPAVAMAVLEHHERTDGSGYPRALTGEQISPLGRILLLAEVVTAFFEKFRDMPAQRLSLMLRLNHRKFPADLVAHILPLLRSESEKDEDFIPLGQGLEGLTALLKEAFDRWEALKKQLMENSLAARPVASSAFTFTDNRIRELQKTLHEAGAHPQQQRDVLAQLQGDPVGLAEVALVSREAVWQLRSVLNACERMWPELQERGTPSDAVVADWCAWAATQV